MIKPSLKIWGSKASISQVGDTTVTRDQGVCWKRTQQKPLLSCSANPLAAWYVWSHIVRIYGAIYIYIYTYTYNGIYGCKSGYIHRIKTWHQTHHTKLLKVEAAKLLFSILLWLYWSIVLYLWHLWLIASCSYCSCHWRLAPWPPRAASRADPGHSSAESPLRAGAAHGTRPRRRDSQWHWMMDHDGSWWIMIIPNIPKKHGWNWMSLTSPRCVKILRKGSKTS